jgi:hypothetical protein
LRNFQYYHPLCKFRLQESKAQLESSIDAQQVRVFTVEGALPAARAAPNKAMRVTKMNRMVIEDKF